VKLGLKYAGLCCENCRNKDFENLKNARTKKFANSKIFANSEIFQKISLLA
jgi:hypothetical protein